MEAHLHTRSASAALDTREKIVGLTEAAGKLAEGDWTVVAGSFDPLTLVQAKRLDELTAHGGKLAVVVLDGEDALLPPNARAALIAALRMVRLVAVARAEQWRKVTESAANIRVIEDPEGEAKRSAEFAAFVIDRHEGGNGGIGRRGE